MTDATKINYFGNYDDGEALSRRLVHFMEGMGVCFEACSYSDTRGEWDVSFTHDAIGYVMCVSPESLGFRPTKDNLERLGYLNYVRRWYSTDHPRRPQTLETVLYQVKNALNGERFDRGIVVDGTFLRSCWDRPRADVL